MIKVLAIMGRIALYTDIVIATVTLAIIVGVVRATTAVRG